MVVLDSMLSLHKFFISMLQQQREISQSLFIDPIVILVSNTFYESTWFIPIFRSCYCSDSTYDRLTAQQPLDWLKLSETMLCHVDRMLLLKVKYNYFLLRRLGLAILRFFSSIHKSPCSTKIYLLF